MDPLKSLNHGDIPDDIPHLAKYPGIVAFNCLLA